MVEKAFKKQRVTMRHVAEMADVSPTAVSFVFSGNGRVSEETVQRVLEVAEKLNYKPPRHNFKTAPHRNYTVRAGYGAEKPSPIRDLDEEIDLLRVEFEQRQQEGFDVEHLQTLVKSMIEGEPNIYEVEEARFQLEQTTMRGDYRYVEPSDWNGIVSQRPQSGPMRFQSAFMADTLYDRIYGGWLGRCAGCVLGRPLENLESERNSYLTIEALLTRGGAYPLNDYVPEIIPRPASHGEGVHIRRSLRGHIAFAPRDDDLDYPILNLIALEEFGGDATSEQLAHVWMWNFPYNGTYTAEHIAYRNLVNNYGPPDSAIYRNPFREYIGAQIRGDLFGYTSPGLPEVAAQRAWRDARISHVKNGMYGEMMVAAMIAAAFCTADIETVIEAGLSVIPAQSRAAEAVRTTAEFSRNHSRWQDGAAFIFEQSADYDWIHVLPNLRIVIHALIQGAGDFEKSLTIAAMCGMDTDCNGATVGSILGVLNGASKIPSRWTAPLNDRLMSMVAHHSDNRISELARRTQQIAIHTLNGVVR